MVDITVNNTYVYHRPDYLLDLLTHPLVFVSRLKLFLGLQKTTDAGIMSYLFGEERINLIVIITFVVEGSAGVNLACVIYSKHWASR